MANDYFQPDFYRFNQDSLILVRWILQQNIMSKYILDLGAGCGVIGIELARNLKPEKLTLVELQDEFIPYLQQNVQTFSPQDVPTEILHTSFSKLQTHHQYDLIVCNPPYYLPGKGQEAKQKERAIARSFLEDDWGILLNAIQTSLQPKGRAFVVLKNDPVILEEVEKNKPTKLKLFQHLIQDLVILELTALNVD